MKFYLEIEKDNDTHCEGCWFSTINRAGEVCLLTGCQLYKDANFKLVKSPKCPLKKLDGNSEDAKHLRLLADWFDKADEYDFMRKTINDEVQQDLRRIAGVLDTTKPMYVYTKEFLPNGWFTKI
jgi:hypothetical protein